MRKIKGLEFWDNWFLSKTKPEALKFLVINTASIKNYYGSLTTREVAESEEFDSLEKALAWLGSNIAKKDHKNCRIFKEVDLLDEKVCSHGVKGRYGKCLACMV